MAAIFAVLCSIRLWRQPWPNSVSSDFEVPDGGVFVDIDGRNGELLQADSGQQSLELAVAEYFRFGTEPRPGVLRMIDGGFVMGSDLEVYDPDP